MKKILITGADSYIGDMFRNYIISNYNGYDIDTIDLINESWREYDFSEYSIVFHVAGLAHQKETKDNAALYYKVNRDLTYEVAKKAKQSNVNQFLFLSSMSVYGMETGIITETTVPTPKTNYGKSKLEAEKLINRLKSNEFKIAILRPPMVYGENCKGNFNLLMKFVKLSYVFPEISNERSMIYIFNLCEYVKLLIDNKCDGIFIPQNRQYVNTKEMIKLIADKLHKRIYFSVLLGVAVKLMIKINSKCRKAFGSLKYQIPDIWDYSYCKIEIDESIRQSVKNK